MVVRGQVAVVDVRVEHEARSTGLLVGLAILEATIAVKTEDWDNHLIVDSVRGITRGRGGRRCAGGGFVAFRNKLCLAGPGPVATHLAIRTELKKKFSNFASNVHFTAFDGCRDARPAITVGVRAVLAS